MIDKNNIPKILIFLTSQWLGKLCEEKFSQAGLKTKVFYSYVNPLVVDLVVEEKPDIIWCDILVGENEEERNTMDGFQAIELLKKDNRTKDIPIIVFSNLYDEKSIKKGLEAGVEQYLCLAGYTPSEIVKFFINRLMKTGKFKDPLKNDRALVVDKKNKKQNDFVGNVTNGKIDKNKLNHSFSKFWEAISIVFILLFSLLFISSAFFGISWIFEKMRNGAVTKIICEEYMCEYNLYGKIWEYQTKYFDNKKQCKEYCVKDLKELKKSNKSEYEQIFDNDWIKEMPEYKKTWYYKIESWLNE